MKKIIFRTMAIVLVLGVAACSRTDETADTPSDQKITELGVIAQSTRSTLGDDNWVEWDANDSFSVFSSMSFSSEFTIKELLDEGHGAKLEGMTIPADTYYILYPYIMDAKVKSMHETSSLRPSRWSKTRSTINRIPPWATPKEPKP